MEFNLQHEMKERGMNQKDLARVGGFSLRTVSRIMAGERKLSDIERRGLLTLPKKTGPKPKK